MKTRLFSVEEVKPFGVVIFEMNNTACGMVGLTFER